MRRALVLVGRRSTLAALTSLGLFVYYVATMGRDLSWFDSAELAMTSVQLGLPHPPGEPLYTLLGALGVRLWPGAPLVACNLLSAVPGAACAFFAFRIADRLGADRAPWPLVSASVLAVGIQATVWDQCSRIEVYALAVAFCLPVVLLALPALEPVAGEDGLSRGRWALAGGLSGAAAGVNPVIATLAVLGVLVALAPALRRRPRRVIPALGWASLAGVVVVAACYAYLPIIGDLRDRFVWGAPSSLHRLGFFLTGRDFAQPPFSHPGMTALELLGAHVGPFLSWARDVGLVWVLGLGTIGFVAAGRSHHLALVVPALCGGLAFGLGNEPYLPAIPDLGGYLMLAAWGLGVGLVLLGVRVARARPRLGVGFSVALVAVTAISGQGVTTRERSGHRLARELALCFLEGVPDRAIAIVESDHLLFPLLYLQQVEHLRPDVVLVGAGLASSGWFWEQLYARHPALLPLPAAGDRWRRLAGFLRAQPDRRVVTESAALAAHVAPGSPLCPQTLGFLLERDCPEVPARLADFVARAMDRLHAFEEIDRDILAWVVSAQAEGLVALGQVEPALRLYWSSAPPRVRAALPLPAAAGAGPVALPRLPRLWLDRPSRNLERAAALLSQTGRSELADLYRRAAADADRL